jgi:hypothetical protein
MPLAPTGGGTVDGGAHFRMGGGLTNRRLRAGPESHRRAAGCTAVSNSSRRCIIAAAISLRFSSDTGARSSAGSAGVALGDRVKGSLELVVSAAGRRLRESTAKLANN